MKVEITVSSKIERTARVLQTEGMFDVPRAAASELRWTADLPLDEKPWNVGLIAGPSGCGKSTLARKLFAKELDHSFEWSRTKSLLDGFPAAMGVKEIIELLSSVGFSSPPSWLRPFAVLSNGEQFRVGLARLLAEAPELAVVDEFSSVVDRTVAQIGSAALAKTVRRRKQKFVAVTCHEDVEAWLQPDWIYRPAESRFTWRELQRRPVLELEINRVHHSAWRLFHPHHYLTSSLNKAAVCFVAFWQGRPVAFDAWLPFFGKLKDRRPARRGHRTVCLPDYQGVGIGNALFTFCASLWSGLGFRVFSNTGHPAEVSKRLRSPDVWKMTRAPGCTARGHHTVDATRSVNRLSASFEYVGKPLATARAHELLETWAHVRP